MTQFLLNRRSLLSGGLALTTAMLAGCSSNPKKTRIAKAPFPLRPQMPFVANYPQIYGPVKDGGFDLPGIPWEKINPRFLRQMVDNPTGEPAGRLVVRTSEHMVYYTLSSGKAMRYGVGLGREGFEWSGRAEVKRKSEWPKWHPPEEMIEREPKLEKYRTTYNKKEATWDGGMDGGPNNPLGARALYIYQGEVDTLYRLHGSPEWNSIGKSVSSGCVRLINQDVIDLYSRVSEGTPILVV